MGKQIRHQLEAGAPQRLNFLSLESKIRGSGDHSFLQYEMEPIWKLLEVYYKLLMIQAERELMEQALRTYKHTARS